MPIPRFTDNPVVLLAGGQGTRLRPVTGDLPKVLAPVSGRPFLEHLLLDLKKNGYSRVVLSLGFGAEAVRGYLSSYGWEAPFVSWVEEPEPLGTAGGLLHSIQEAGLEGPVTVANADTWIEGAWSELARLSPSAASIGVVSVTDIGRYGEVALDESKSQVLRYVEKTSESRPGVIYSGIAVLSRSNLDRFKTLPLSLERDVFPAIAAQGKLHAFQLRGRFTDIGIPEDYHEFCRRFGK